MGRRVAFIGHRNILCSNDKLRKKLKEIVKKEIDNGCNFFTMGMHGEFDDLALSVCLELKREIKSIEIEVAFTSYNAIKKYAEIFSYSDIKTCMYEIEEEHYKRQIIVSNQKMVECCDTLICYVDERISHSGAKNVVKYARKIGLEIINLI